MPKKKQVMSVAVLEQMLKRARDEVAGLQKERAGLAARLDEIDARLAELGASTKGRKRRKTGRIAKKKRAAKKTGKKRGRKKMTLAEHVARVLQAAKGPVSPQQITEAIKKKGVSKSKYLNTQVMQILRSGKVAVKKVGRGQYIGGNNK